MGFYSFRLHPISPEASFWNTTTTVVPPQSDPRHRPSCMFFTTSLQIWFCTRGNKMPITSSIQWDQPNLCYSKLLQFTGKSIKYLQFLSFTIDLYCTCNSSSGFPTTMVVGGHLINPGTKRRIQITILQSETQAKIISKKHGGRSSWHPARTVVWCVGQQKKYHMFQ